MNKRNEVFKGRMNYWLLPFKKTKMRMKTIMTTNLHTVYKQIALFIMCKNNDKIVDFA